MAPEIACLCQLDCHGDVATKALILRCMRAYAWLPELHNGAAHDWSSIGLPLIASCRSGCSIYRCRNLTRQCRGRVRCQEASQLVDSPLVFSSRSLSLGQI